MSDENIVMFPSPGDEVTSIDQIRERVASIREVFVDSSVEQVMQCVIESVAAAGYDMLDETMTKDVALVAMSLKSALLKSKGADHPLQDFAQDMFVEHDGYVYLRETDDGEEELSQ